MNYNVSYSTGSVGGYSSGLIFTILLISYLLSVYPVYKMYTLANLKNPWIAFIPGIGQIKMYNLADFSMWTVLVLLIISIIPFIGALVVFCFSIYLNWIIAKNFGFDTLGCILTIFFGIFVYWYIALTNRPFVGEIKSQYINK